MVYSRPKPIMPSDIQGVFKRLRMLVQSLGTGMEHNDSGARPIHLSRYNRAAYIVEAMALIQHIESLVSTSQNQGE